MKFKTTEKAIKAHYQIIISAGYCDLQHLLYFSKPIAYTAGVDGWKADIYDIDGVAIVTGYRPFGTHRARYDVCNRYDMQAMEIIRDSTNCDETDQALHKLLRSFIVEVTG